MEYNQDDGVLSNVNVGSRVRKVLGREKGSSGRTTAQGLMSNLNMPDDPGPAMLGRTPMLGMLRRNRNVPVLRDRLRN